MVREYCEPTRGPAAATQEATCHERSAAESLLQPHHDYPLLRTCNRGEITILSSAKVFLLSGNGAKLTTKLEHTVFQSGSLFEVGALLGGDAGGARLVLDADFKVDHFVGEGADAVVEAEAVFAYFVCREDEVALAFFCAVEDGLFFARFGGGAVD